MNQVKNRLAIFDIDGTLTNSIDVHQSAFTEALEAMGLYGFDKNWGNYKHHTDSYILKTIFEAQVKEPISNTVISQFEDLLHELILNKTNENTITEIEGARLFIHRLFDDSNYDIVFATGSLLKPAKLKLTQIGLSFPDDLIISANQIFTREELVLVAIEQAKKYYSRDGYDQIISFGDGLWDYEAAKNTRVEFIGIGNEKLLFYGVDTFFKNFMHERLIGLMDLRDNIHKLPDFDIA